MPLQMFRSHPPGAPSWRGSPLGRGMRGGRLPLTICQRGQGGTKHLWRGLWCTSPGNRGCRPPCARRASSCRWAARPSKSASSPLCRLLLCSLDAGCAGFYAGGRHGVARGGACAASGGGCLAVAVLALCGLRWLLRWHATVWREAARVLPRAAAAWPSLCSLYAGCAGFYAGGRHGVARGGTCAASGGG